MAYAKEHADKPNAARALFWISANVQMGKELDEAVDRIIAKHLRHRQLSTAIGRTTRYSPARTKLLQAIMANALRRSGAEPASRWPNC